MLVHSGPIVRAAILGFRALGFPRGNRIILVSQVMQHVHNLWGDRLRAERVSASLLPSPPNMTRRERERKRERERERKREKEFVSSCGGVDNFVGLSGGVY